MDKKKNFLNYVFLVIIGIMIVSFVKIINHKKEINNLLEAEDISKLNVATENLYDSKENKDGKVNYENELDKNINTVTNSSNKVTKKIKNGRDFLSLNEEKTVDNNIAKTENRNKYQDYINDEVDLLARLIYSEAGNQPYMGKVAVGNVVLYRSRENNESIESVIYSKNQFDGINTDSFNKEPNEESKKAALEVLNGGQAIKEGYYFANLNLCSPNWAKNRTFICRIGDHWFFRKG